MSLCPGCGLDLPDRGAPATSLNATQACWELYGELAAYTTTRGRDFIHQHAVDAYQAQHAVRSATNIGPAFSLIGLCMALERGATGLEVQRAHMHMARLRRDWPPLDFPAQSSALTVCDVLDAEPGDDRDEALMRWCRAVWDSWGHAHAWTRKACDELLGESFSRRVRSR